ncbi:MAG: hypothetical protein QGG39_14515 [Candidatus Poribacteria bacterium]|jgi:hypothetical protein|nr:hypothetical protein [Candidatus Poribacteria bacterium]
MTDRRSGESDLAFAYFQLYRDQQPGQRSLRSLTDVVVNGKKRSLNVLGRWSSKYEWPKRLRDWDFDRSKDALRTIVSKRNRELVDFIEKDFTIAKISQGLTIQRLTEMFESDAINCGEFRALMSAYGQAREFLKELIGIFEQTTHNTQMI